MTSTQEELFEFGTSVPGSIVGVRGDPSPMVRADDHETSVAAADGLSEGFLAGLRGEILALVRQEPDGYTDGELEAQPQFGHLGPSTVRKRRSELYKRGLLIKTRVRRNGMTVWIAADG